MATLFFSYSHKDQDLRDQLETQLSMLKRQGVLEVWHDRRIEAGSDFARDIDDHVETDDIILLLVSPDFLASDYCYEREMRRAMERHEAGEAVVIPVILRACDWHGAPFGKLQAVPRDALPVTQWTDRDQAFLDVAKAIRKVAERLNGDAPAPAPAAAPSPAAFPLAQPLGPRSSNLWIAKTFTERDKDQFRLDTFEYMAKFFENSLAELGTRNPGIEGAFRKVDANRFTAAIYRGGKAVARCTIFMGGSFMRDGIAYSAHDTDATNSYNESLSVEADDQSLFLRSLGMAMFRGRDENMKLSQEGAAELYWNMLIEPLQRDQNGR